MADPYTILGVARNASEADIKKAYRNLAQELHPDRNTDNRKAAQNFAPVTHAYALLLDKDRRAQLDRGEMDVDANPTPQFGAGGGRDGDFRSGGTGGAAIAKQK